MQKKNNKKKNKNTYQCHLLKIELDDLCPLSPHLTEKEEEK